MISIRLFGRFSIRRDEEALEVKSQSLKELLSYLLLTRGREHYREFLASELKGDFTTPQSLKHLRQSLWHLNKFLEEESITDICITDRECLQIVLSPTVRLDVAEFEQAREIIKRGDSCSPEAIPTLRAAAAVYQGDLLEGWDKEWCLVERERYRDLYLDILDLIIESCIQNGQIQDGLYYSHKSLALEPMREGTHRQIMELRLLSGNRTAALRQFYRCKKLLKDEFDVEPSLTTITVFRRAREDLRENSLEMQPSAASPQQDVMSALEKIITMLSDMKQTLER